MKKILLGVFIFITSQNSFAQGRIYASLDDIYRDFMVQAHSQFSKETLNGFMGFGGDKRFMSNSWLQGGATNNFEVTISGNYQFNYDFLGQELHAKWKDTTIIVNTSYVKRFFLVKDNQTHNFVKSPAIDPPGKYFFESLAFDQDTNDSAKIQLLKLRTIKKLKANKDSYLANFSGDYNDELDNNIDYYINFPDNNYVKIKLNKKSISAALEKYKEKVDAYFKQNSQVNEETAAGLIRYINQ